MANGAAAPASTGGRGPATWCSSTPIGCRRAGPATSWAVLAAIGKVESDHGRSRLPGVRSGWNQAGAAGPMQFGIGVGRAGNAWARYGRDFDGDGRISVYAPGDAIPAAARYLCDAGAPHRLDAALYAYNPSTSYVAQVKQLAGRYTAHGGGR